MRFYISHKIRGSAGKNATHTQMQANCNIAIAIANQLREAIPVADFYVPAESEPFVQRAYDSGFITEKQILDVDCQIILDTCDAVIIYLPVEDTLQGGRKVEYDFAINSDIPVYIFSNVKYAIKWVADFIVKA